jgi:putative PEP-CTERM system TPR-repeat lipoprotein
MAPRNATRALFVLALAVLLHGCAGESEDKLIASARGYLDKQDLPAATIQLKTALQKNPNSAPARLLLGQALLAQGDAAAALVELGKARDLGADAEALAPETARALLARGEAKKVIEQFGATTLRGNDAAADLTVSLATAHAAGEDLAKAQELAARALQLKPRYAPALLLQARLKLVQRDLDGALALLDETLAAEPRNEAAALLKGQLLQAGRRELDGALAVFRKAITDHPKSVQAQVATINVLREMGRADESKAQLAELVKLSPNHVETLYLQAQQRLREGQAAQALELAERLLKAVPDNPRALLLTGTIEYEQRAFVKAESHLAKAVQRASGLLPARLLLAQTYLRMGEPAKALDVLGPVTEGAQADANGLALAGEAHLALGNAQRADEAFKRATAAAPDDPRVRTAAALGQLARGQTAEAIGALEAVAASDKGTRADLALITARLRAGDAAGALKAVEGLARKTPDRPLPDLLRARILQQQRDLAGARSAFEAALKKDPKYFPAVAGVAGIDVAQGKPAEARKRFDALIAADPASHQAHLALAELAAREGRPPEEITQALAAAVKANPTQAQPRVLLVERHLRTGDAQAALAAAQEAAAALPDNAAVQDALGRAQLAGGDTQQALSTFGKLASQQPKNPFAQIRLAEAHAAAKDLDGARRALDKALALQPGLLQAKAALASIAVTQGRVPDALAIARQLQKAEPKNPAGYALEGDVQRQQKNWPLAIAAHRAALAAQRNTEGAIRLHRTYGAAGQATEADRFAAEWRKEHAEDAAFSFYLGDMAIAKKDWAGAEAHYAAVVKAQPRNALALNNIAWLMVQQGKPGAVKFAEQANQILPGRAQLLDTWATALAAENQLPQAITTQKDALARSPRDPALRLNLAKLYVKAGDKQQAKGELDELAKLGDKFGGQAEVSQLLAGLR